MPRPSEPHRAVSVAVSPWQLLTGKIPTQTFAALAPTQRIILQYQALLLALWICAAFFALLTSFLIGVEAAFGAGQWVRHHIL